MEHIDTIKWAVVFTDIKNFTLKTSLLTQMQIWNFLNKQDEIVLPIISKYFWKIIKTIWDSYMIVFEKAENAVIASIEIQKKLQDSATDIGELGRDDNFGYGLVNVEEAIAPISN